MIRWPQTAMSRFRLLPDLPEIGWTPYLWLVYFLAFFLEPVERRASGREWLAVALATALFLVLYFRGYWKQGVDLLPVILGQALLGVIFVPINSGALVFFIYAAACVGFTGPPRVATTWLLAVVGGFGLEAWLLALPPPTWIPGVVFALLIGAANTHFAEAHRSRRKLRLAQDEVERLAKLAERERIARDLHDLLGHTLSVIALKAELAGRLLARDPAAAATEIDEVQRISREALSEVRRAVEGYRERGLPAEVAGARRALQAAGVSFECELEPPRLPAAVEGVLALALREAVTNVIRHAGARSCRVTLERQGNEVRLEVSDDGRGGGAAEGVGLTGMRERAAALGGRLDRLGEGGTTLRVSLPLAGEAPEAPASLACAGAEAAS